MKIRHSGEPLMGQLPENTFVAFDDLENRLGEAVVAPSLNPELRPERPYEIKISASCQPAALNALLGAATTRAFMLRREQPKERARIYAECAPGDEDRLEALTMLGFQEDDALIRMRRWVASGPVTARIPLGCTLIADALTDVDEQRYFLERYMLLYKSEAEEARAWLANAMRKRCFRRYLLIARDGLAGEMLVWTEDTTGVTGHIYTSPAWRRRGVAAYLMEQARLYFLECGAQEASLTVRRCLTPVVRLAAHSGYRQEEVVMKYPGIEL